MRAASFYPVAIWILAFALGFAAITEPVSAEAVAADKPPLSVALIMSSRLDQCFDPGNVKAIQSMTRDARDRLNAIGGIGGHRIELTFLDDKRDPATAVENVRRALADPTTVALVGLTSSQRGKAVFDALGPEIKSKRIPFISDLSVNSLFAEYPNVFTTRASQDDERLPVMLQFIQDAGYNRVAFIGAKDLIFSASLADGLKGSLAAGRFVADHRLTLVDEKLVKSEVAAAAQDIKDKAPDLVVMGIGSALNGDVVQELLGVGASPALLLSGQIDQLPEGMANAYANHIYQLSWDGLPDIYRDRLQRRILADQPENWIFEGAPVPEAPGWAKGECKPRPAEVVPNPLRPANLRAIRVGSQYADMLALLAALGKTAPPNATIDEMHRHIIEGLKTTYAFGRGAFQGGNENWSFRPGTRAAARTPFIVKLPRGLGRTQLAPVQYVRLKSDKLRAMETLFLDVDLVKAFRIDDNEQSFFAEFYLSVRNDGKGTGIEALEFANSFLDPQTGERQLNIRVVSRGGANETYPDNLSIYYVSGRFMFEPELSNYPFDSQRFSIDIRPRSGSAPFIVQPPLETLRDDFVESDGWDPKFKYVGFDEDFVQTIDALSHEPSVVPFYKASFAWIMARQTTDYYLRVVVPLGFILIVAYLSIFIPLSHFEAIVTIQVTALLSAVALYLSLSQLDADTTTVSDRIFIFTYMSVSLMIGISILRMNHWVAERPQIQLALGAVHVALVPILVVVMAYYVRAIQMANI
ncbi:MAG: ABC transporter substrate-binding protein [Hyphomicrobium sp.]|nr:ABC transporter substrate-binding protein [Hyphomicrobium sp.]